ncbi:MAG TPA: response regulator transcription factor [Dehalococcoidia bacterium]|nr:response regulator transcription factor [Dehalococcoidia bacterium]
MDTSQTSYRDRGSLAPSVLLIDDGESLLRTAAALREHGFTILEEFDSGNGARRALEQAPQVIMVAEDMPPVDGVGLLEMLREVTASPIVVVGKGEHTSRAQALLDGADMYLSRPVSPREMLARVRALLRRTGDAGTMTAGLNSEICMATSDLEMIFGRLTHTEAKLFRYMLDRVDHLVTREELLTRIWGSDAKDTSLRFYVWQLRRKLAEFSATIPIQVLNFNGMGYLLKLGPLTQGPGEDSAIPF